MPHWHVKNITYHCMSSILKGNFIRQDYCIVSQIDFGSFFGVTLILNLTADLSPLFHCYFEKWCLNHIANNRFKGGV